MVGVEGPELSGACSKGHNLPARASPGRMSVHDAVWGLYALPTAGPAALTPPDEGCRSEEMAKGGGGAACAACARRRDTVLGPAGDPLCPLRCVLLPPLLCSRATSHGTAHSRTLSMGHALRGIGRGGERSAGGTCRRRQPRGLSTHTRAKACLTREGERESMKHCTAAGHSGPGRRCAVLRHDSEGGAAEALGPRDAQRLEPGAKLFTWVGGHQTHCCLAEHVVLGWQRVGWHCWAL